MDYRRLGKSGLQVSEFSFGAWVTFGKQVGEDSAASIMGYAYDTASISSTMPKATRAATPRS